MRKISGFKLLAACAVLVAGALTAATSQAQTVSANFSSNDGSVTGSAGVVSAANWNNYANGGFNQAADLMDDSGVASTLDLEWFSNSGTWFVSNPSPGDGSNGNMLNGYLNSGNTDPNAANEPAALTLQNIPYTSYDVYVYFNSDNGTRTGNILGQESDTGLGGSYVNPITYYFGYNADTSGFFQTTSTDSNVFTEANYAMFSGTLDFFNVEVRGTTNPEFGGIAGVQIVNTGTAIPEPGSIALLGLAGLGLITRRRRNG